MFRVYNSYFNKFLVLTLCFSLVAFSPVTALAETSVDRSQFSSEEEYRSYLYSRLLELQSQLLVLLKLKAAMEATADLRADSRGSDDRVQPNPHYVQVTTMAPSSIGRSVALLQAQVDRGSADHVEAWFQYGKRNSLNRNTKAEKITWYRNHVFKKEALDLEPNTTYSYRVVAEDDEGYRQYGQVRRFSTPASATTVSFSGRPLVETDGVTDIKSSSAKLRGFVSMNDFGEGVVFFTYGTNLGALNDVEDYDTFEEVKEIRGEMSKWRVYKEFYGRDMVELRVWSLKRATKYYYNVCIEYRDGGRKIRCSDTESFVTLN